MSTEVAEVSEQRPFPLMLVLLLAVVASVALLWLVSGNVLVTASYAGALAVVAAGGALLLRLKPAEAEESFAAPDWSVTVAAIERPGEAIAITDRANRLACANSTFVSWFGAVHAPPNLPIDRASLEALARAAREAWREGSGSAAELVSGAGQHRWSGRAERAGRGEDYLIWRFHRLEAEDTTGNLASLLTGNFGRLLSRSGIEAALVAPDGTIYGTGREGPVIIAKK